MFQVNDTVLYGSEGICVIQEIAERTFDRRKQEYYILQPLYGARRSTIFVPTASEKLCARMHKLLSAEEIQEMINKVASQSMVGDMNRYQQMAVLDSMTNGSAQGGQMAVDMASMQMGMMMGQQIMNQMTQTQQGAGINPSAAAGTGAAPAGQPGTGMNGGAAPSNSSPASATSSAPETGAAVSGTGAYPNFCPNCGQKTDGANFCSNCGQKLK